MEYQEGEALYGSQEEAQLEAIAATATAAMASEGSSARRLPQVSKISHANFM